MPDIRNASVWDLPGIERFLKRTVIPVRIASLQTDKRPLVSSLWFLYEAGSVWCAAQRSSSVARFLEANPYCGFEVAPDTMPYSGVRGQGSVTLDVAAGPDMLLRLIDRYVGTRESNFAQWLIKSSDTEVAIRIQPDWLTSWDFSDRMRD